MSLANMHKIVALTDQLRLRASRKCADGYSVPFDVDLDNTAAETIIHLWLDLAKAATQRESTLDALECVADYFWNPDRKPGHFREEDVEEVVRAEIASLRRK